MNPIGNQKHNFDQKSQTKAAEGGQNAPNKIFSRVHVWVSKREQHISNSGKKSDTRIAVRRAPESQNCTKKKKKALLEKIYYPERRPHVELPDSKTEEVQLEGGPAPDSAEAAVRVEENHQILHDRVLYPRPLHEAPGKQNVPAVQEGTAVPPGGQPRIAHHGLPLRQ